MEYSTLLQVALLVHQYQCIKIVRPWLESWMKNERTQSLEPNQEGWLFIAWVFGREKTFELLAKHMVLNSNVTPTSLTGIPPPQNLLPPNGKPVASHMPPAIVERILWYRNKLLNDLLEIPYFWLSSLEQAMRSSSHICTVTSQSNVCDAAVYGSLLRGLLDASLYPQRTPASITDSVKSVAESISRIKLLHIKPEIPSATLAVQRRGESTSQQVPVMATPPGTLFGSQSNRASSVLPLHSANSPEVLAAAAVQNTAAAIQDHAVCADRLSGPVAMVLAAAPNPVLDSHRFHMRLQRGESLE
ncbi:hypothetical protein ONS96_010655 [Cadophora gregata f. sp. sojae]|nr:hypothetical protein ONS96_010655 [Cadophora gregata f. sp. sojae]